MSCAKTLTFDLGITAKIYQDDTAENPIQVFDCEANVSIWHRDYDFGNNTEFKTPADFEAFCKAQGSELVRLPVYLYDHSGLTVNTTGFSCPWDSGQVGWVWVTKAQAKERWGCENRQILANLRGTVSLLNDYLTSNVYGYVVEDEAGNELDSCWGFYGNLEESDGVVDRATSSAKHYVEKAQAELAAHGLACQAALAKFHATQHKGLAI